MGRGSGRDIWTLTPDLQCLLTYNTAKKLERSCWFGKRGQSHRWGQTVKMQIQSRMPTQKKKKKTGQSPSKQLHIAAAYQGHWWCRWSSEPEAEWWAAPGDPPRGNTAGNPGQPPTLPRAASGQRWRCSSRAQAEGAELEALLKKYNEVSTVHTHTHIARNGHHENENERLASNFGYGSFQFSTGFFFRGKSKSSFSRNFKSINFNELHYEFLLAYLSSWWTYVQ